MEAQERAEKIGEFRELLLLAIAERGPDAGSDYRRLRDGLIGDSSIERQLPDFIVECRTAREFWDYIQQAFESQPTFEGQGAYARRSRYITAQLLPVERSFRPPRQRAPGTRPAEVRLVYPPVRPAVETGATYVAEGRLAELRAIHSNDFDLTRLVRICEELNVTFSECCYIATIILIRALLDHVPPIFGHTTFSQVANSYGSRSFKEAMQQLEKSARKISDDQLHQVIRRNERLPTAQRADFRPAVDVLLAETLLRCS